MEMEITRNWHLLRQVNISILKDLGTTEINDIGESFDSATSCLTLSSAELNLASVDSILIYMRIMMTSFLDSGDDVIIKTEEVFTEYSKSFRVIPLTIICLDSVANKAHMNSKSFTMMTLIHNRLL
jgi:hypothetical protein